MENQLLIKRITHYGWYVFFALFAFVCIYSKLRDIHYLSDEMYLVIPYIIFSFLFTDLLSDEKITVKLYIIFFIFIYRFVVRRKNNCKAVFSYKYFCRRLRCGTRVHSLLDS